MVKLSKIKLQELGFDTINDKTSFLTPLLKTSPEGPSCFNDAYASGIALMSNFHSKFIADK